MPDDFRPQQPNARTVAGIHDDPLAVMRDDRDELIRVLQENGVAVRDPGAILCPFHKDTTPSARVEHHKGTVWRFRCRAACCNVKEDIFGLIARFTGRRVDDVMRDQRRQLGGQKRPASRPSGRTFFETRERLTGSPPPIADEAGQGETGRASTAMPRTRRERTLAESLPWMTDQVRARMTSADHGEPATVTPGLVVPYVSPEGELQHVEQRFDVTYSDGHTRKTVRPFTAGQWKEPKNLRYLYRLPELAKSTGPVLLVEGAKCGIVAGLERIMPWTAWGGGACAVGKSDWSPLAGRDVWFWPDVGGESVADQLLPILHGLNPPARVSIIRGHGLTGEGDDVEQWREARGAEESPDSLRAAIAVMAKPVEASPVGDSSAETSPADDEPTLSDVFSDWGVETLGELRAANLPEPAPIIDGVLYEGEVMGFVGSTKTMKTYLTLGVAVAVAAGKPYAGLDVPRARKVLVFDTELTRHWWKRRVTAICDALGVDRNTVDRNLTLISLRGQKTNVGEIRERLARVRRLDIGLIVVDALYLLLPDKADENSNSDMTKVFQELLGVAHETNAAVIAVRHASKGDQSQRDSIDVGSGAGSAARAVDVHATIRRHKEEGAMVMNFTFRNVAPMEPFCLRFDHPTFVRADDLDPMELREPGRGTGAGGKPSLDYAEFARRFLSDDWQTLDEIKALASGRVAVNKVRGLCDAALRAEIVDKGRKSRADAYRLRVPDIFKQPAVRAGCREAA